MGTAAQAGEEEIPARSKVRHDTAAPHAPAPTLGPATVTRESGALLQIMRYFLPKNQGTVSNIDSQRPRTDGPNATSEGIRGSEKR